MKEASKQISDLVERFERNIEAYRSPAYNETQLRIEFIDPFFEALGWDITNKAGYAEQYKDVIHEDAIKIAGATKEPDYCFRVGGVRKFFLETKKPSIDIKVQTSPAYQLRRYAWSAKLPISILTDFEETAIYDCRLRPKPSDKASVGRIRFYTYSQYIDSFEEIYTLFSKDAVGGGGGGYGITLKPDEQMAYEYFLGLLNSKLLDAFLKSFSTPFSGGYFAYNRQYIEQLPIRIINFSDPRDKIRHDRMVKLVEQMLSLHKQLVTAKTPDEKTRIQRQIDTTDHQIDRLVYELYGLTEKEIQIVEGIPLHQRP